MDRMLDALLDWLVEIVFGVIFGLPDLAHSSDRLKARRRKIISWSILGILALIVVLLSILNAYGIV